MSVTLQIILAVIIGGLVFTIVLFSRAVQRANERSLELIKEVSLEQRRASRLEIEIRQLNYTLDHERRMHRHYREAYEGQTSLNGQLVRQEIPKALNEALDNMPEPEPPITVWEHLDGK